MYCIWKYNKENKIIKQENNEIGWKNQLIQTNIIKIWLIKKTTNKKRLII